MKRCCVSSDKNNALPFNCIRHHLALRNVITHEKHLLESLVSKIKALKLLTYKHKVRAETILKTVERLCPNDVSPALREFLGLKIEPMKAKSASPPAKIGKNLVMTSRVKLIEEKVKDEVMGN